MTTQSNSTAANLHLLAYLPKIGKNAVLANYIMSDEFIFSTFFAAIFQGFRVEEDGVDAEIFANICEDTCPVFKMNKDSISTIDISGKEHLINIVDRLRTQFNENVTSTYVRDFIVGTELYKSFYSYGWQGIGQFQKFCELIETEFLAEPGNNAVQQNLGRLQQVIHTTDAEQRLIEINFLMTTDVRANIFRDMFFRVTKNPSLPQELYTTMIVDASSNLMEAVEAIRPTSLPITLGIVQYDFRSHRMGQMSEFWVLALSIGCHQADFVKKFIVPLEESKKKVFSGAVASANATDEAIVKKFFDSPAAFVGEGSNFLIYGDHKLDLLGFMRKALANSNYSPYRAVTKTARSVDIPSICYIAQKYAETVCPAGTILVITEAESALSRYRSRPAWLQEMIDDMEEGNEDKELDSDEVLLTKNKVPTIWISKGISSISPENIGKFLFHIELKGGTRADRRREVEQVIDELELTPEIAQKLSKYTQLTTEQIRSAGKLVEILNPVKAEREPTLLHAVENSQKALQREEQEELRDSVTKYDLNLLNIAGNVSLVKMIAALKKKKQGSLCMYGPPGTGKTQLAEYMAVELDMPLIIKPASALLSKWLGESEKNIAAAFAEAKSEGAILLIDEADSFMRDRSMAEKSWEVTQVNELLQQIERFPGIFICATNLFSAIDAAALRRFTFKLEFQALTYEQRWRMLINEAHIDINELGHTMAEKIKIDLDMIQYLTPGDFATVRRQIVLLDEEITVDEWLVRLRVEAKAKLAGLERQGFMKRDVNTTLQ